MLWLIKLWLRVPVEGRDGNGTRRMSGGKSNKRGTPQSGVASPLHHALYVAVREEERREASPTVAIINSQTASHASSSSLLRGGCVCSRVRRERSGRRRARHGQNDEFLIHTRDRLSSETRSQHD